MVSREGNYSICTGKPVTPNTSSSTTKLRSHEPILRTGLALRVLLQVSKTSGFMICDTQPRPGSPTLARTRERSWRFSGIDAFKHLRVTLTPLTRVYDAQWKRLRNGKRVPSQISPPQQNSGRWLLLNY